MSTRNGHVVALLPMTSAAKLLGLKFDTLMAAARDGKLKVASGSRKPSGKFVQPQVTVEDLRTYAKWQEREWRRAGTRQLLAAARKIARAKFPKSTEHLDDVLRARPFMWGGGSKPRRRVRA